MIHRHDSRGQNLPFGVVKYALSLETLNLLEHSKKRATSSPGKPQKF